MATLHLRLLTVCLLCFSPASFSDTWVKGQGKTLIEATQSAILVADILAENLSAGCIDDTRLINHTNKYYVVEAHYSDDKIHCDIKINNAGWLEDKISKMTPDTFAKLSE